MNNAFMQLTIKSTEQGSRDALQELDCWLLEHIQQLEWRLWKDSLCKTELNGIMAENHKEEFIKLGRHLYAL